MPRDFLDEQTNESMPDTMPGRDFLIDSNPQSQESFRAALMKAPFRVEEDLYRGGMNLIKSIPDYIKSGKTESSGLINPLQFHPLHSALQVLAGSQELINNLAQLPKGLATYANQRLNLLPEGAVNFVNKITPEDTTQAIHSTFDEPKYPGEKLLRGLARNAFNLGVGGKVSSALNPLNLTAKSIAKDVVNTEKQQVMSHSKRYDKIWDEAKNSGFNQVPVDTQKLSNNLSVIEKYKTPREYQSFEDFILSPTLQNAQKAQSDLGIMHRKLEEKSRTSALTSEERALYDAAKESEKHIENNMFKDSSGKINQSLQDKYKKLTDSYRLNVVPYRYNGAIQAYKNKEILANELVNSLSHGEFAAKKGNKHPEIKMRNMLKPFLTGAGLLGGGAWLYNQSMGNAPHTD